MYANCVVTSPNTTVQFVNMGIGGNLQSGSILTLTPWGLDTVWTINSSSGQLTAPQSIVMSMPNGDAASFVHFSGQTLSLNAPQTYIRSISTQIDQGTTLNTYLGIINSTGSITFSSKLLTNDGSINVPGGTVAVDRIAVGFSESMNVVGTGSIAAQSVKLEEDTGAIAVSQNSISGSISLLAAGSVGLSTSTGGLTVQKATTGSGGGGINITTAGGALAIGGSPDGTPNVSSIINGSIQLSTTDGSLIALAPNAFLAVSSFGASGGYVTLHL